MTSAPGASITKREREVLELLGAGMTNKEIAKHLDLATRTVETHVERVLGKLGVSSRTRAVIEARRLGFLSAALAGDSSAEGPRNNLPLQLGSLLAREDDTAEIVSLLDAYRLVTLTGSGGVGKTRLALAVATDLVDRYAQGVWFTDFSTSSDPQALARAVGKVLGVRESPGEPLSDLIVRALRRRRALLLFDNCEHVAGAVADLVDEILHSCQGIRILATSRQSLGIIGEIVYRVRSLTFPSEPTALNAAAATHFGAIELFVDRARAVENRFTLTNDNASTVGEICRRVDGIPLAIELAAARVYHLSIDQLAERIGRHFGILSTGDRKTLPRQRTMRAVIDWSYNQLSQPEQRLFRRLAIFVGGFTLELATEISADMAPEADVLDLLASLIDKSLVQVEFGASGSRYRLLEVTQQYAKERMEEAEEYAASVRAFASAMLKLAGRLNASWEGMRDRDWFAQAVPELGNFQSVLWWALEVGGDVVVGQRLVGLLGPLWSLHAEAEGRLWIKSALEKVTPTTPQEIRAALELRAATFGQHGTASMLALARSALAYYDGRGEARMRAIARVYAAADLMATDRIAEGEALLRQAMTSARTLGMPKLVNLALQGLAKARLQQGDTSAAKEFFTDAQAVCEADQPETAMAISLSIAEVEFREGAVEAALRRTLDVAAHFREVRISSQLAVALNNAAAYLNALERFDEARALGLEALTVTRELGDAALAVNSLQHLVAAAALDDGHSGSRRGRDLGRLTRLFGFVHADVMTGAVALDYTEEQEYDKITEALRTGLGRDQFEALIAEGGTWTEDQAAAEALLI